MWARWETAVCAVSHGVHTLFERSPFVRGRTDLPDRRMPAALVIEQFDVLEQLAFRFATAVEAIGELGLHGREAAFHHRVVVAVAAPTHAADDAVRREDDLIILARVRAALVGVVEQAYLRAPALERHLQGFDRDMPVVHGTDGPSHDEPREQIQDRREVELAAAADGGALRVVPFGTARLTRKQ